MPRIFATLTVCGWSIATGIRSVATATSQFLSRVRSHECIFVWFWQESPSTSAHLYSPSFVPYQPIHASTANSFARTLVFPRAQGMDGKIKPLYFRGRRIIDETLKALASDFGLGSAKNVLLTGCSAGMCADK